METVHNLTYWQEKAEKTGDIFNYNFKDDQYLEEVAVIELWKIDPTTTNQENFSVTRTRLYDIYTGWLEEFSYSLEWFYYNLSVTCQFSTIDGKVTSMSGIIPSLTIFVLVIVYTNRKKREG